MAGVNDHAILARESLAHAQIADEDFEKRFSSGLRAPGRIFRVVNPAILWLAVFLLAPIAAVAAVQWLVDGRLGGRITSGCAKKLRNVARARADSYRERAGVASDKSRTNRR